MLPPEMCECNEKRHSGVCLMLGLPWAPGRPADPQDMLLPNALHLQTLCLRCWLQIPVFNLSPAVRVNSRSVGWGGAGGSGKKNSWVSKAMFVSTMAEPVWGHPALPEPGVSHALAG